MRPGADAGLELRRGLPELVPATDFPEEAALTPRFADDPAQGDGQLFYRAPSGG